MPAALNIEASQYAQLFLGDTPLIDVRAPIEFSAGALPMASNLPLMNDAERHDVGKCYKANGQNAAIALGEELVSGSRRADRIAAWQAFAEANPQGALYCFRGGLRSRTAQRWLQESGVDYPLIIGGYKALRTYLIESLAHWIKVLPVVVVGGRTGTGKTRVLQACTRTVDLEALANHRGSSFGANLTPQPTNIDFENSVSIELIKLAAVSQSRVVVFEDEARLIGRVSLPKPLRDALQSAPVAILDVALEERVQNVLEDYVIDLLEAYQARDGKYLGLESFYQHHRQSVLRVQKRLGKQQTQHVLTLLEQAKHDLLLSQQVSQFKPYLEYLLTQYYDPMYDYQIAKKQTRIRHQGDASSVVQWMQDQDRVPA